METYYEILTNQGKLRGAFHIPEKEEFKIPIVFIHGYFSGNRVGPARLYLEMARFLESGGHTISRFDALGVGESDGKFSAVTFDSEIRDFSLIILQTLLHFKKDNVILLGHSMGANLALNLFLQMQKKISSLFLIAPDIEMLSGIDHLFSEKQMNDLENKGYTYRKGLHINNSFIKEIRNKELLFDNIKNKKIPTYVFHGNADELYSVRGSQQLARLMEGKLTTIENGDHNFLNPKARFSLFKEIQLKLYEFCRNI